MTEFHVATQEFLGFGLEVSIDDYLQARRRRFLYVRSMDQLLGQNGLLLTPSVASEGWPADGRLTADDEVHGLPAARLFDGRAEHNGQLGDQRPLREAGDGTALRPADHRAAFSRLPIARHRERYRIGLPLGTHCARLRAAGLGPRRLTRRRAPLAPHDQRKGQSSGVRHQRWVA